VKVLEALRPVYTSENTRRPSLAVLSSRVVHWGAWQTLDTHARLGDTEEAILAGFLLPAIVFPHCF